MTKWAKYYTKSLVVPKGRESSEYYLALVKFYGIAEADKVYKEFKYQSSKGIKTINKINYD